MGALAVALAVALVVVITTQVPQGDSASTQTGIAHDEAAPSGYYLPLDDYLPTDEQLRTLSYAQDLVLQNCLSAKGIPFQAYDQRGAFSDFRRYGLSDSLNASKYGYDLPPASDAEKSNIAQEPLLGSTKNQPKVDECFKSPAMDPLRAPLTPTAQQLNLESYRRTVESGEGNAIIKAFHQCIQNKGVQPGSLEESPFVPAKLKQMSFESQITAAKIDLACKHQLDTIPSLLRIESAVQKEMILTHTVALSNEHDVFLEAVTVAMKMTM